jgi:hypothetical protein
VCRLPEALESVLDYQLPTDIVAVQVERSGTKHHPELDIMVSRKLPAAAYVLLIASVLCASTYDISMQLLVRIWPVRASMDSVSRVCKSC